MEMVKNTENNQKNKSLACKINEPCYSKNHAEKISVSIV